MPRTGAVSQHDPRRRPRRLDGRARAIENALGGSRTAAGHLDVTATATKAVELVEPAFADDLVVRTRHNVEAAVELCWAAAVRSAEDVLCLIEAVNRQVVDGLLVGDSIHRASISDRFPYASPDRAGALLDQLAEMWLRYERQRRSDDAASFAAWIIWVIDLYGHPFIDGCGKTAAILSAFALDRVDVRVPRTPARSEVVHAAYEGASLSWSQWCRWYVDLVGSNDGA